MTHPGADTTALIVFAKAPIAGQAKTRLIPALGAKGAAALHARLVHRALENAAAAGLGDVELCCAPDCEHVFFQACRATFGVDLTEQAAGDLGQRMARAFERALAREPHAILIGSDCPALGAADLREADRALRAGHDAVLTPAEDGGYALIGLRRLDPSLFASIDWSTPAVMAQTRARLNRLGWRWSELAMRWDVDRPEDLERLQREGCLDFLNGAEADAPTQGLLTFPRRSAL